MRKDTLCVTDDAKDATSDAKKRYSPLDLVLSFIDSVVVLGTEDGESDGEELGDPLGLLLGFKGF